VPDVILYTVWGSALVVSGYYGWSFWIGVLGAVLIAYLKRGWHANNGVTERRAVIIGTMFAMTPALGLYYLGAWFSMLF